MIAHIITDTYPLGTIVGAPVLVSAIAQSVARSALVISARRFHVGGGR